MRLHPLALLTLPALTLTAAPKPSSFADLLHRCYEEYLALYPIEAGINGDTDPRFQGMWPDDLSPAWRARVQAWSRKYQAELARVDKAKLSPSERLSYDSLRFSLRIREEATRILGDKAYLESVYRAGAQKASYVAEKTLRKVYKKVGFVAR